MRIPTLLFLLSVAAACGDIVTLQASPTPSPSSPTPTATPVAITPAPGPSPIFPGTDCGNADVVVNNLADPDDGDQDCSLCKWFCTDWPGSPYQPGQVVELWDFDDPRLVQGPSFAPCGW